MHLKRKIVLSALAVLLCFFFQTPARAAEYPSPVTDTAIVNGALSPIASPYSTLLDYGTCGDSVSWTLYTDGVLKIFGEGKMADYDYQTLPWRRYAKIITSCVIEDGVTSIGIYAFGYCTAMTEVSIPSSVTDIGSYAFKDCEALTDIVLPKDITRIRDYTFWNCSSLRHVSIPSGVKSVGGDAFYGCTSLTTVILPDGVTSIGSTAFHSCASLTSIVIPGSVTRISSRPGNNAFNFCKKLTVYYIGTEEQWNQIDMPCPEQELRDAPRYYLSSVDELCTITAEASEHGSVVAKEIAVRGERCTLSAEPEAGYDVAAYTVDSAQISGNSFTVKGNHTVSAVFYKPYDTALFGKCGAGISWALTDDGTLHIFGTGDMDGYWNNDAAPWKPYRDQILHCEVEDGVTSIGAYAFDGCTAMRDITISGSVASIQYNSFRSCNAFTDVYYAGTAESWNSISKSADSNSPLDSAAIHYNVYASAAVTSDAVQLTIRVKSSVSGQVIVALYARESGRLICVNTYAMSSGKTDITVDTAALEAGSCSAKIFMVSDSFVPVGIAVETEVQY